MLGFNRGTKIAGPDLLWIQIFWVNFDYLFLLYREGIRKKWCAIKTGPGESKGLAIKKKELLLKRLNICFS